MDRAVSNTSPLLYLHLIGGLTWLRELFAEIWVPQAVMDELLEGARRGHDVPRTADLEWVEVVKPGYVPSEWLALDLGAGELAAMALALENPDRRKGNRGAIRAAESLILSSGRLSSWLSQAS